MRLVLVAISSDFGYIRVLLLEKIGKNFKKYLEGKNNINTFAKF